MVEYLLESLVEACGEVLAPFVRLGDKVRYNSTGEDREILIHDYKIVLPSEEYFKIKSLYEKKIYE